MGVCMRVCKCVCLHVYLGASPSLSVRDTGEQDIGRPSPDSSPTTPTRNPPRPSSILPLGNEISTLSKRTFMGKSFSNRDSILERFGGDT